MTHSMLRRVMPLTENLCVLSHFFLRPPLQNSLSFDMMCVKMQRERREKPMSPQNHDTQDYYDRPPVRRKRRKKTPWQKFKEAYLPLLLLLLGIAAIIALIIGGVKLISRNDKTDPSAGAATGQTAPSNEENQTLLAEAAILAAQYDYDGALTLLGTCTGEDDRVAQAVADYTAAKEGLTVWEDVGEIPLISFQPLIADPSRAFDGDDNADYYDRNSLTTSEFSAILDQLYEKGYVLVSMEDLAAPDETGVYKAGKILLPEGKKPLILSLVPLHYTAELAADGFARRLVAGSGGEILCEYLDADGNRVTGSYDFVSILERFLAEHPDFSYRGARAVLGISGDPSPLGYDITDETEQSSAKAAARCLLDTGYEFASFTYGGIGYGEASDEEVAQDVKQWEDALEPVLGSVNILFYANGSDLDSYEGAKFQTLYEAGFRYFCALDSSVTSWVQIADTYVHQARRTINGTRITQEADLVADLFDAAQILSPDRPK